MKNLQEKCLQGAVLPIKLAILKMYDRHGQQTYVYFACVVLACFRPCFKVSDQYRCIYSIYSLYDETFNRYLSILND